MAEPATAAPAATNGAAPPEASSVGLVDILEGIAAEPEAESAPEAEAKSAPEAEKPKDAKKAEKEPPKLVGEGTEKPDHEATMDATEELLSSGELTPEAAATVKATLDATRARNRILDKYSDRVKKRDAKVKAEAEQSRAALAREKEEWQREIAPSKQAASAVLAELSILNPRSGANAREKFAALARLTGMDGQQFYEEVTLGIAADGKIPEPSRSETALQARISQLEGALQQKLQGDQDAAGQAKVAEMKQFVAGHVEEIKTLARDAEQFPAIAAWAGDDEDGEMIAKVADWAKKDIVKAADRGKVLDKATAIGRVEARLARLKGAGPVAATQVAESGSSKSPGGPARGAGKGTTVLPTSADRSTGHVREPRTEQERDAENLRDPQFRAALPFLR